jgi:hypothetical protein
LTKFHVEFLFQVGDIPTPIYVTRDVLGTTYRLSHDGLPIQVEIPRERNDFLFWTPFVPGEYWAVRDIGQGDEAFLYIVRISVTIDAPVSAAKATIEDREEIGRASAMMDRAREVASHVATEFVAWVRVTTRMTSLLLSSEVPPLAGPVRAFEVESGIPLRVAPPQKTIAYGRDPVGKYHLDATDMVKIAELIEEGRVTPVPETLLADAEYHAEYKVHDFRRAVLMAAIACEVKVKTTLRERVAPAQRSLLDFALDNPREVAVTAAYGLFDKLMLATLGKSLRVDNRSLFRDIEHLYKVRNQIAHHGAVPTESDTRRAVRGARQCFTWLDSLRESPTRQENG